MFDTRLNNLRKSFDKNKIDSLLVSSVANIFYLTGLNDFSKEERDAFLFVTSKNAFLFTNPLYFDGIKKKLPKHITPILHTELFDKIKSSNTKIVGFERNLTYAEYRRLKKETGLKFVLTKEIVEQIRIIKDEEEIKYLKAACKLTDKTYDVVRKLIKIGVTEREIAWAIEKYIKENGGELAFDSIVAFGPNSAVPHHKTQNYRLKASDEFVLLDFGAKVNGYHADMTRTILTKQSSTKAKEVYNTVLHSQKSAVDYIKSRLDDRSSTSVLNIQSSKMAQVANEVMKKNGFNEIPHGLGHGIGVEIHELPHIHPKAKEKLQKGMVFTIEPGIYIPGFGGVRIEDDYLLDEILVQLTNSPK